MDEATDDTKPLSGKTVLVTGAARRVGRLIALACARAGASLLLHHAHSPADAQSVQREIQAMGRDAHILQCDFTSADHLDEFFTWAVQRYGRIQALVNSAAIFEPLSFHDTSMDAWNRHLAINLTAPFRLSQLFAGQPQHPDHPDDDPEAAAPPLRILNILDWRATHPGADHFPYTVSKASLAAMTRSMACALAPHVVVNGLALGAILASADGADSATSLHRVPMERWCRVDELDQSVVFLLGGPAYISGEIVHLDGGRHFM